MGQFEYAVGLSDAMPDDIPSVAFAFRAGEEKAVANIIKMIESEPKLIAQLVLNNNYLVDKIREAYNVKTNE